MSTAGTGIGLPDVVSGLMMLALNAYALSGGADFGGGVWDLLARGPRRREQRELVHQAIAPIWEANHVWLIIVIVMLFTAFPPAFAAVATVLHIPLALMLIGIVLRGSAFVFQSYGAKGSTTQRRWGRVFASASTITPVLLGIVVGAIASGSVGRAAERVREAGASFREVFVDPWLAPFPLAVGILTLALFSFLAAVYLTLATPDAPLKDDFRRRALGAGLAVFVSAFGALAVAHTGAPEVRADLTHAGWGLGLQAATAIAAIGALGALRRRRWQLARVAAAAQVSLILWGWVLAQYPLIIPPALTIPGAAAPRTTLELLLWGLAGGTAVLVPSLIYLFRTFARSRLDEPSA